MVLVHRELSWILRFEVEKACLPVDGRPEERVARTDRVAAAQAGVPYPLDPLCGLRPRDDPAFEISIDDSPGRGQCLPDGSALSVGTRGHGSGELVIEVGFEDPRHPCRHA